MDDWAEAALPVSALPVLQVRPLPPTLLQWQDPHQQGDYFDQIKNTDVGYLSWSRLPIQIYVEPATATEQRSQGWVAAVLKAVQEWSVYLPLRVVLQPEQADITVWRSTLPIQASAGANAKQPRTPNRVRSAETRYELYISAADAAGKTYLLQRCAILIRPSQTENYIQAAARHELGHALGIWGHSPRETDTMYFAQVRNPPPISPRDLNTLKRIYQQPTRLGWPLPNPGQSW